jgi:UDP-glucuronate 4-epimerase
MALALFTRAILEGRPIDVFNDGKMQRDFTYVDDLVEGLVRILARPPMPDPSWSGEHRPRKQSRPITASTASAATGGGPLRYIRCRRCLRRSRRRTSFNQPGDVPITWADVDDLSRAVATDHMLRSKGIGRFVMVSAYCVLRADCLSVKRRPA